MSHKATLWAIEQRGLKPATKIVLWHLCDRFNPDFGCFPSQARLAADCEISRSALNDHLDRLEAARLLRRVRRIDPVTKRQMPTRYILGFEEGFAPEDPVPGAEVGECDLPSDIDDDDCRGTGPGAPDLADPCPETAHGDQPVAVSGFDPDPCPENARSRVRNPDTNLVREPLREPVKEEEEDARGREVDFDRFFGELLGALGLDPTALPGWWQGWPARLHVRRWIEELGLSEDQILETATASRRDHPEPPDGPKALDRAMQRAAQCNRSVTAGVRRPKADRRQQREVGPRPTEDELAAFYARMVNGDGFLPANTISNTLRDAMLARGLVTAERLKLRGVQ
jgi:hypothetical protein